MNNFATYIQREQIYLTPAEQGHLTGVVDFLKQYPDHVNMGLIAEVYRPENPAVQPYTRLSIPAMIVYRARRFPLADLGSRQGYAHLDKELSIYASAVRLLGLQECEGMIPVLFPDTWESDLWLAYDATCDQQKRCEIAVAAVERWIEMCKEMEYVHGS